MSARAARSRPALLALAGLVVTVGVAAALYGTVAAPGNSSVCRAAQARVAAMTPHATGAVAAVMVSPDPAPLPNLSFRKADGTPTDLAAFRGRTLLVNLWATWCAPCKEEMPALNNLQAALGGPDFEVVAINIDTRNLDKPKAWLKEAGIDALAAYADPSAKVFQQLKGASKAQGMPTTLLVDGEGCELGLLHGPADWASPEAKALVKAALGRP